MLSCGVTMVCCHVGLPWLLVMGFHGILSCLGMICYHGILSCVAMVSCHVLYGALLSQNGEFLEIYLYIGFVCECNI